MRRMIVRLSGLIFVACLVAVSGCTQFRGKHEEAIYRDHGLATLGPSRHDQGDSALRIPGVQQEKKTTKNDAPQIAQSTQNNQANLPTQLTSSGYSAEPAPPPTFPKINEEPRSPTPEEIKQNDIPLSPNTRADISLTPKGQETPKSPPNPEQRIQINPPSIEHWKTIEIPSPPGNGPVVGDKNKAALPALQLPITAQVAPRGGSQSDGKIQQTNRIIKSAPPAATLGMASGEKNQSKEPPQGVPEMTPEGRMVPRELPKTGLWPSSRIPPGEPAGTVVMLHRLAVDSYASIPGYIVRFRRRERIRGTMQPEEIMLLKFRKEPFSVYLKWLGEEGKGREVVYVKGEYDNKLHTLLAAGDVPFVPAGKRMSFSINNPLVTSKTRHPINEAGIGNLIDQFGTLVSANQRGDGKQGTLKYLGMVRRPEFGQPVEAVLQTIPPRAEEGLPNGGRRFWYFDTSSHRFPVLIITQDAQQQEVEYYCYQRLFSGTMSDDDFNPDRLWSK